jgi:AraC-like DNA-binding protein/ligand-binding sensor protein
MYAARPGGARVFSEKSQVRDASAIETADPHAVVSRLKRHLEPTFSFLKDYLGLLCDSTGVGGGGVFFRRENVREALDGLSLEARLWTEFPGNHELVASIERTKRFCSLMRKNEAGFRRCMACDVRMIQRAAGTKRLQIAECHAGLTDIMAPIVVHGNYVGVICLGQFLAKGKSARSFAEVWERIGDIPGLQRGDMEEAFRELAVLDDEQIARLAGRCEQTARTLSDMWESMADLAYQEKQMGRMRQYQERDLAETLLSEGGFSEEEARAQAAALGLRGLPTVALVVQLDPTARASFSLDVHERRRLFAELAQTLHEIESGVPDALVTSIQPGEFVMLLLPRPSRNEDLAKLRLKELAGQIAETGRKRTGAPILVGLGADYGAPRRIAESYQQACRVMWSGDIADIGVDQGDALLASLDERLAGLEQAVEDADQDALVTGFERALRVVASAPGSAHETRRLLFTKIVDRFLDALQAHGADPGPIAEKRRHYLRDFPALDSIDDIVQWFRNHLLGMTAVVAELRASPEERAVSQACAMIASALEAPLSRREIATRLGISEGHFGKVFRRIMGQPFRDYVQSVRMERAQALLLESKRPIGEVALDVGYSDTSAFTRAFTRSCGVSPSEYRESPRDWLRIENTAVRDEERSQNTHSA